ncbi:hypothetical protein [Bradyrhizobium sp. STM 3557]|uniref:hypothetical protein n=1 Tax=Bradyrhizobium sp. STM 3557 TaxID=578920 RepID=UPI00388F0A29
MSAAAAETTGVIRAVRVALMDLDGIRCGTATLVCDHLLPELIMRDGEPFLFQERSDDFAVYRQVRPYRCLGS